MLSRQMGIQDFQEGGADLIFLSNFSPKLDTIGSPITQHHFISYITYKLRYYALLSKKLPCNGRTETYVVIMSNIHDIIIVVSLWMVAERENYLKTTLHLPVRQCEEKRTGKRTETGTNKSRTRSSN